MDKAFATPTARTLEPHPFEPGGKSRWCKHEGCQRDAGAYVHASEEERRAFDEQQGPKYRDEASRDALQLELDRDWFGYLTTANYEAVTERIRRLIAGKRYTWVDADAMGGYRPHVRCGMEAEKIECSLLTGSHRPLGHITVVDTYGVWGIDSSHASQSEARAADPKSRTYLHFKRDRYGSVLEMEHYAISGNHLWWVIAVEGSGW